MIADVVVTRTGVDQAADRVAQFENLALATGSGSVPGDQVLQQVTDAASGVGALQRRASPDETPNRDQRRFVKANRDRGQSVGQDDGATINVIFQSIRLDRHGCWNTPTLDKDARIRIWPKDSPWINPGTFTYPARQRWFASYTQMANEPVYVDGGDTPNKENIYYHYGLDIGGCEGRVDVVAATDGLVVSSGDERLPGYEDSPVRPRYDVVYIRDDRGWFYRYSHLKSIEPEVRPGRRARMGQKIGLLGKEGGSGGWSHLHFEIRAPQPSGRYGVQEGYAFLWQAYEAQYKPRVRAVARPHHLMWSGQGVNLDGSRSEGRHLRYEWTFTDGTTAEGAKVQRTYDKAGSYAEILRVTDSEGNTDYDFNIVQVIDKEHPDRLPPTIHATYAPTWNIRPGYQVTFKVRTFRTTDGEETWNFGDGSPPVTVKSDNARQHDPLGYAETDHRYEKPGTYLVKVERTDRYGQTATGRLVVQVE